MLRCSSINLTIYLFEFWINVIDCVDLITKKSYYMVNWWMQFMVVMRCFTVILWKVWLLGDLCISSISQKMNHVTIMKASYQLYVRDIRDVKHHCPRLFQSQCAPLTAGNFLPNELCKVIGGLWQNDKNRPTSQIPQCTRRISHNSPFWNRNVHIYVTKWCAVWYWSNLSWDLRDGSIPSLFDSLAATSLGCVAVYYSTVRGKLFSIKSFSFSGLCQGWF